jgi:hypothetical protein
VAADPGSLRARPPPARTMAERVLLTGAADLSADLWRANLRPVGWRSTPCRGATGRGKRTAWSGTARDMLEAGAAGALLRDVRPSIVVTVPGTWLTESSGMLPGISIGSKPRRSLHGAFLEAGGPALRRIGTCAELRPPRPRGRQAMARERIDSA